MLVKLGRGGCIPGDTMASAAYADADAAAYYFCGIQLIKAARSYGSDSCALHVK
jgi:hypothetical protein